MKDISTKMFLGIGAPTLGAAISLSDAEIWLRLTSLGIGILVGLLSAFSIYLTIRKKWKHRNDL